MECPPRASPQVGRMLTCAGGERNRGLGRLGQGRRWHSSFTGVFYGFPDSPCPTLVPNLFFLLYSLCYRGHQGLSSCLRQEPGHCPRFLRLLHCLLSTSARSIPSSLDSISRGPHPHTPGNPFSLLLAPVPPSFPPQLPNSPHLSAGFPNQSPLRLFPSYGPPTLPLGSDFS